jgi:hypothetical protein
MKRFVMVAGMALAASAGSGCSDEEGSFKLIKVTGTVTKNGKPLADAKVSFIPDAGNKNSTPGIDLTGTEGNYLLLFKGRTGVSPGKYKVIITPPLDLPPALKGLPEFENQPGMLRVAQEAANLGKKKTAEVKKEATKTEFDREVEDQSSGVMLDFDVKTRS